VRDAQQADYVAVLYRYPTALDAYELGFAPGVREDYSYQIDAYPNVDLPVVVLDNDFTDPDIERYVDAFEQDDPSVAIVGDAYSSWAAEQLSELTEQLRDAYPQKRYVAVPKCRDAFDVLDDEVVLGYPIGYSDLQADDIADVDAWRGRPVHVLGGSPPTQYEAIMDLTQPTLSGEPPADIVGMDWNGFQKGAYLGEYWSDEGCNLPIICRSARQPARACARSNISGRNVVSGRRQSPGSCMVRRLRNQMNNCLSTRVVTRSLTGRPWRVPMLRNTRSTELWRLRQPCLRNGLSTVRA